MRTIARRVLVPALTAAVVLGSAGTAAAVTATASDAAPAGSGTWSAVLVDSSGQVYTGRAYSTSWGLAVPATYLSVRNNGTLQLGGQTYTITRSGLSGTFTATACVGAAWTSSGTCPTNKTVVLDTTLGVTETAALALAPGESASIKISAPIAVATTVTLSVSVGRSQARPASASNA
jgi:hypothetical protein